MNTYIVFDLETTGLGTNKKITEIGAVKVHNGEVIDTFETLVNPGIPIPIDVQEKTHITNEMVADAPYIDKILPDFLNFIGNDCLVGHNIRSFDMPHLQKLMNELYHTRLENNYIDTLYEADWKLKTKNLKLSTIADYFGIDTNNAHRALADCFITYKCYEELEKLPYFSHEEHQQVLLERKHSHKRQAFKYSDDTVALQNLNKYITNILADGKITDVEIYFLNIWLQKHSYLSEQHPFDDIFLVLTKFTANKKLSNDDRSKLINILDSIINPIGHASSVLPPDFNGKSFCLSGVFDYGSRKQVEDWFLKNGAIFSKNVKKSLDFLIIGNQSNPNWITENYGKKILQAQEYNKKGANICILKETDINW